MDENKLAKLREIGYTFNPACGMCEHSEFNGPITAFGSCKIHTYDHLKHSGSDHQLSISRFGSCPQFQESNNLITTLGAWFEFVNG